jgi:hypothetical protein
MRGIEGVVAERWSEGGGVAERGGVRVWREGAKRVWLLRVGVKRVWWLREGLKRVWWLI